MPNAFDQFDTAPATAAANPFDAFDGTSAEAFRAAHGADVPLPSALATPSAPSAPRAGDVLVNQSIGAGDAFSASLLRTLNALPFIAGGLQNAAGDDAGAARNFALFDVGKAQADALEANAALASKPAAVAGSVLGFVPKLAAPEILALDAVAHGTDLSSSALQQNKDLSTAYTLGGLGTAAGTAGLVVPPAIPGNLLTRLASGAVINAGLGAGEQTAEHAVAPDVVAAPTAESIGTQGGIGALIAAVLGHGARADVPTERLVADPEPQGLPEPQGQTKRAAGATNPGPVTVDRAGTAATVPQGVSAFAQALAARMAGTEPGLPEPTVRVDAQGNAMTTADQHAAVQPPPAAEPDPLGLTARLRALIDADPRSAREGALIPPKALPAPAIAVDRAGEARTTAQQQAALAQQQNAAAERQALGITPDIERTQGVRWAKQAQAAESEAQRQARLKELDDAIAQREAQNKPKRGMNATPDASADDALTFLAKSGGLDRRTFVAEGLDPALARAPENLTRGGASRPLFRAQGSGGMSLDDAARVLWQHGYLPEADNNAALDLILHGVNQGEPAYSVHHAPQDDLLSLQQARQDADHHVVDTYADVPFSRKPADPSFSFAGERARTADRGALQQAKAMEAMGRDSVPDRYGNQPGSPEDTHIATGWHRGVDGKWRFEIDDSAATLDDTGLRIAEQFGRPVPLKDVLDHPALFDAYPELGHFQVRIDPSLRIRGVFDGHAQTIRIRPPATYSAKGDSSLKSVLLHEAQHWIQENEDFGRGGSKEEFARPMREQRATLQQRLETIERMQAEARAAGNEKRALQLEQHRRTVKNQLVGDGLESADDIDAKAGQQYVRLAGEVEARNTQRRLNMDKDERRAVPPSETADVPRHQQIVRFNADRANAEPASHADLDAIAKYNRVLSQHIGAPVAFTPAAHVPEHTADVLAEAGRLFDIRAILVHNETPDTLDINGVTLRDGVMLVNEDATSPALVAAGHELIHQMRRDAPDLYDELVADQQANLRTDSYAAVLAERARKSGEKARPISHDEAREELIADAAGDALGDPDFIERLAKRNPGLFRRFARYALDFLARVSKRLRSLGSGPFLKDVEVFRSKLEDILARYAERQQGEAVPEGEATRDPTQTPAFRKWFGDSKVVDAHGKPLVVYHGRFRSFGDEPLTDGITSFKPGRGERGIGAAEKSAGSVHADGIWFGGHGEANEYAGVFDSSELPPDEASVYPVYLSIQNPKEMGWAAARNVSVGNLVAQGYDGAYIVDNGNWVAFRPEQIKSATGNRGTFDPNEPSILFSRKPAPSEAEYLQDMPSRRPGESQSAYLRRVTHKNGEDIKAATALVKQQRALGRVALRGMMATQARQMAIADAALDAARKTFDKTPDVINYASVHQWETGQPIADADFRHFVATMQDGFDQRIAEIQRLAPGALQSLIEHYMPHLYEDSGKAAKWYQNVLGKRPLEGDKSFLKQRTWPTLKEAMASGLKPISPNPVDWVLMKYAQMDKFIGLLRLKEEFTRRGWLMKMEPGQRAPEGFARVDDPAFQVAGGLQGYFAVPELIAKDINNYLAPGLSKYGAWRSVRAVQNAMVSWNLGWSAFHAGFTSIDNAVTHGAVGLQRLVDGNLGGGLMALVKAVPTMITSPFEGGKLNRQWTGREQADPHTAALLDLLEQGGARMKMGNASAEYNNALPQVMRTIRRLQAPGAVADGLEALQRRLAREPAKTLAETGWGSLKGVGRAISAIGEVGSFLIHHVLVPNQKMAARVTLLKFELDRYAKQLGKQRGDYTGILSVMHPDVARQLAADVVDKVDFRLGQMTYDNFFYPKIAREIAQLLVMAPGWQAGAFQTMTGGIKDIGRLAKPEKLVATLDKAGKITDAHRGRFTNNLANLAMLFLMVGGGNALYQWLVSGIEPDEAKDLVAPRTGRKNADDSDERIVLPSYMKDHYEFFHHPLAMASHKLHPAWRLMWEIGHNEDYFGTMIRDPHHPLGQQAKELAGYLVKSMLPFTATNAAKVAENGGGAGEHVANFVGITPASASLARTPFQAFVAKGGAKGWEFPAATPAEAEYQDRMRKAETAMRTGQTPATDGLTARDLAKLKRRVQTLKPELQFDRLSLADKLDAYDMATPTERQRYHLTEILRRTRPQRSVAFRRLPKEEQQAVLAKLQEAIRGH